MATLFLHLFSSRLHSPSLPMADAPTGQAPPSLCVLRVPLTAPHLTRKGLARPHAPGLLLVGLLISFIDGDPLKSCGLMLLPFMFVTF